MQTSAHWLEMMPPAESIDFLREMAHSHARESGVFSDKLLELIKFDNLRGICEFEFNYETPGLTANMVYHARQACAFFTKLKPLDIGVDREELALSKFLEAEELCKETNNLFRQRRSGGVNFPPDVERVFHAARRKIARVLGEVPRLSDLNLHFGPGATRATRRKDASIRRKLAEKLQCSEELSSTIPFVLEELPHLLDIHSSLDRVDEDGEEWSTVEVELTTSKLSFVPKNAKSLRSICTEPGLNTLVQLGYGQVIAKRLASVGVDIRDQTLNQRLACEGSLTGALATLDLSSASDTIARELVFELLPLDWAMALNRARSEKVRLPNGRVLKQEKFSPMGNGFTFPLETLIFWSLAASCCTSEKEASAYGDDLIVPTDVAPRLMRVLHCVGFVVNESKSYLKGPFRESCGKDYYLGTDVRPVFQKDWVNAQSLFVLHNFYVRAGDQERAEMVLRRIHPTLLIWGPDGYGDGHLLGDHPRRKPAKYVARQFSGYFFDTYVTRTSRDEIAIKRGEHVVALYSIYRRSAGDEYLPRRDDDGLPFFAMFRHRGKGSSDTAPLPLALADDQVKALPLPGVSGYKKISVYTLGN